MTTGDSATNFRPLALFLAWVWPGLGHMTSGARTRGLRIMAGMLFLILTGLLVGGLDAVDRREDRLWFVAQVGCGPLVIAIDLGNQTLLKSGRIGNLLDRPLPPGAPRSMAGTVSDRKGLAHAKEFGTLFIALAGMLNIVVMLDAGFRRTADDPTVQPRSGSVGGVESP